MSSKITLQTAGTASAVKRYFMSRISNGVRPLAGLLGKRTREKELRVNVATSKFWRFDSEKLKNKNLLPNATVIELRGEG